MRTCEHEASSSKSLPLSAEVLEEHRDVVFHLGQQDC